MDVRDRVLVKEDSYTGDEDRTVDGGCKENTLGDTNGTRMTYQRGRVPELNQYRRFK